MLETFNFFLHLGATGFGGPLVLIQQMRHHYVDETKKMSALEFDQAFTLIKMMPGPIALQMAAYLGFKFHKLVGAILAAFGIIFPSFMLMILIGYFYSSFVNISFVNPILEGFLFSVSAIILLSLRNIISGNNKYVLFYPILILCIYLSWIKIIPEPVMIIGFGALSVLFYSQVKTSNLFSVAFFFVDWEKIYELFKTCLITGTVVFGTGLAMIPVLKTSFVDINNWITLKEFNDAVVFGQMTPGPITITSTFLGYQCSGFAGALAATFGIFLMPFIHMVTWFPLAIKFLSKQKWIHNFLIGATAAVVGCIFSSVAYMNKDSYSKPMFWIVFLTAFAVVYVKPKISIILIIMAGGILNLVVSFSA